MEINLPSVIGAWLMIGIRMSGIVMFTPFFGDAVVPRGIKAGLVVTLTALLFPVLSMRVPAALPERWPLILVSELLIGIALGITANLIFEAAQMAGQVLSVQMGYSLVNILDPQTQIETNVLSVFHQNFLLLIFLALNAHHWLLRAMARSFDYLPPGSAHLQGAFVTGLLAAAGSVLKLGVQIAAPILGATIVADLFLGLLSKASPQLHLLMLRPSIKGLFGVMLLITVMRYWPQLFSRLLFQSLVRVDQLLHLAR
jgi:flagellar biosynthesis protein FliR